MWNKIPHSIGEAALEASAKDAAAQSAPAFRSSLEIPYQSVKINSATTTKQIHALQIKASSLNRSIVRIIQHSSFLKWPFPSNLEVCMMGL